MKIFVLKLLFTIVTFLYSVQSMEQSTPRYRAGGPLQPCEMKRYDLICRGSNYIGQFVEDVKFPFKITAPGKFVLFEGKPVALHPKELIPGDLLIRSNLKWAVYQQGWFHELPEAQKKALGSELKVLPKCEPFPDVPLSRPSPVFDRHFPERNLPLARPDSSTSLPPPAEPLLRGRSRIPPLVESPLRGRTRSPPPAELPLRGVSRSPPPAESSAAKNIFSNILGFKLEELESIRLVPDTNQNRIFELQRYTFPPDKPIQMRSESRGLRPMPIEEQIVVSALNGDVFAIMDRLHSHTILRGIYTPHLKPVIAKGGKRAKINIHSGAVKEMTPEEIAECPLGMRSKVTKRFRVYHV